MKPPSLVRPVLLLVLLSITLAGCNRYIVRDSAAYTAEIGWTASAFQQSGDLHLLQAAASAQEGGLAACVMAADLGLVLTIRGPWHVAMALYLIDAGGDPGPAPEVPSAEIWCTQRLGPNAGPAASGSPAPGASR